MTENTREAEFPIPLNDEQERAAKEWAADNRLWTTQETVEFNLRTFARKILSLGASGAGGAATPFLRESIESFLDAIIEARGANDHAWLYRCARDIRAELGHERAASPAGAGEAERAP